MLHDLPEFVLNTTQIPTDRVNNDLWMGIKGPHTYTVTALGLCVKWPYM